MDSLARSAQCRPLRQTSRDRSSRRAGASGALIKLAVIGAMIRDVHSGQPKSSEDDSLLPYRSRTCNDLTPPAVTNTTRRRSRPGPD